jgi:flagellar export protein FliJ
MQVLTDWERIIDVASVGERSAATKLAESKQRLEACVEQAEMLRRYQREYHSEQCSGVSQGNNAFALQNLAGFNRQLGKALEQSQAMIANLERDVTHKLAQWRHQRARVDMFKSMQERVIKERTKQRAYREEVGLEGGFLTKARLVEL